MFTEPCAYYRRTNGSTYHSWNSKAILAEDADKSTVETLLHKHLVEDVFEVSELSVESAGNMKNCQ